MNMLDGWSVEWFMLKQLSSDVVVEEPCLEDVSTASSYPEDRCVYLADIGEYRLPEMDPYQTHGVVAAVSIGTNAKLDTRNLGLKVVSMYGDMENDGDHDDSPAWDGENFDSNEFIVTLLSLIHI